MNFRAYCGPQTLGLKDGDVIAPGALDAQIGREILLAPNATATVTGVVYNDDHRSIHLDFTAAADPGHGMVRRLAEAVARDLTVR
jgi:hypothetical protein